MDYNGTLAVDGGPIPGTRRGVEKLAELVQVHVITADTFCKVTAELVSDCIFVFRNKKKTAIKIIAYDGQGFWMCQKRLSKKLCTAWNVGPPQPDAGNLIKGSGGVRKVRWAPAGSGKSCGIRVIYYWKKSYHEIWMLTLYSKSERAYIPGRTLNQQIAEAIKNGWPEPWGKDS